MITALEKASQKINLGGEDLSSKLLDIIRDKLDKTYKTIKGKLLAEDINDKIGYIFINIEKNKKIEENVKNYRKKLNDFKE